MILIKNMKQLFQVLLFTAAVVAFFACGKDNSLEELRSNELATLDTYIKTNYKDLKPKPSGLYFIPVTIGTGDSVKIGNQVDIHYAIWGLDGKLKYQTPGYVDGHYYDPESFIVRPANQLRADDATNLLLTPGLHEAITYMQTGTIAKMILNSGLAFGQNGTMSQGFSVSGFTTVIAEVRVYKIYK
jgi:FKBP-type peptidyl-prolyl cis-trans isomerase